MIMRRTCGGLAVMPIVASALAAPALADTMTMWVRAGGANAATHLDNLWNPTHGDKIEFASFDLVSASNLMKTGFSPIGPRI